MKRSRQSLIKLFCVGGTIGAVLTYAGLIEPFWIEVHHVSVQDAQLNRVLKGMTALHLTDLHIGALGKRERRVLELVAEIKPRFDLLDRRLRELEW